MSHLRQRVKLAWDKAATVMMLVDTGATFSMISEPLARAIGIPRSRRPVTVQMADGRRKKVATGTAIFTVAGREAPATILIGEVAEPILGVETLEALGLAVDPRRQRLTPTRGYAVRI
jgi:predicted aspartyl protease